MRTRQGRQGDKADKKGMIGHKTTHKLSILWIKSSLPTIPLSLPGLAFTGWASSLPQSTILF